MAVEFKTVVNFKLAMFLQDGVTVPLSALLLSGDNVEGEVCKVLERFFSVDIDTPKINSGFFAQPSELTSIPLEKYLVALGLAVK
jgi:hypothetical protein